MIDYWGGGDVDNGIAVAMSESVHSSLSHACEELKLILM